jgi:hypothetical protein
MVHDRCLSVNMTLESNIYQGNHLSISIPTWTNTTQERGRVDLVGCNFIPACECERFRLFSFYIIQNRWNIHSCFTKSLTTVQSETCFPSQSMLLSQFRCRETEWKANILLWMWHRIWAVKPRRGAVLSFWTSSQRGQFRIRLPFLRVRERGKRKLEEG